MFNTIEFLAVIEEFLCDSNILKGDHKTSFYKKRELFMMLNTERSNGDLK